MTGEKNEFRRGRPGNGRFGGRDEPVNLRLKSVYGKRNGFVKIEKGGEKGCGRGREIRYSQPSRGIARGYDRSSKKACWGKKYVDASKRKQFRGSEIRATAS